MKTDMEITIDANKTNLIPGMLYRGVGMVSANNSSRLLVDYKTENPEAYNEILNYTFGEDGLAVSHLKIEMGSDVNSSSGTEASVKRSAEEAVDVTRGAGFVLASDAKKINPDLTLDMLYWSEPKWVTDVFDKTAKNYGEYYAARYKWYKEILDGAYDTYGLEFDYVSANRNEKTVEEDWIKYLASALDNETEGRYDYSAIKIVAGEEVCTWNTAGKMLTDPELLKAVDVVGSHYTSWSGDDVKTLAATYGKELWFSEGCSTMEYSAGTWRFDESGSGLTDINGMLDIANRYITMYPGGGMTMCEFQPVVSAYYDGVTYCHKQFITANEPWSGYYSFDPGFFMMLHFSQFIKKGWAFVDGACYGDGSVGGDGHAIVDATYTYMTATDPETGDYSTVITNTTDSEIVYRLTVAGLNKAWDNVDVWETKGPSGGDYFENYFVKRESISPEEKDGDYTYIVKVAPYSIVTVSTVGPSDELVTKIKEDSGIFPGESKQTSELLSLPYSDDFEYADYEADYLSSRGYAPRFTTDQGGAFEVVNINGNNVLMQKVTPEIKADDWGKTPDPTTKSDAVIDTFVPVTASFIMP